MSPADWSDTLTAALEGHAFWIALLIFLGATVVGTLLMVPAWIFPLAAGAAFGWTWGTLVSMVDNRQPATRVAFPSRARISGPQRAIGRCTPAARGRAGRWCGSSG